MSGTEYEVNTELLSSHIKSLLNLVSTAFSSVINSVEAPTKESGATHDEILALLSGIKQAKDQMITLIGNTVEYLQGVYDAVTEGDKQGAVGTGNIENTNNQKNTGGVIVNENYEFPQDRSRDVIPYKKNLEGFRSSSSYDEVIRSFDVEHTPRYQQDPDGNTWCNLYVADVTSAMDCPIPHYYNPATGAPMSKSEPGGNWLNADGMKNWLKDYGSDYGWVECTREEAIKHANSGMPTVATGTGHIAMVAPQYEGETDVMLAQTGYIESSHVSINQCWTRNDQQSLKYYYHI